MVSTAEQETRFRCLELATTVPCIDQLDLAERFYAFVTGVSQQTPIQRVRDALNEIEASRADR